MVGSTSLAETMDPEDWGELVAAAVHTMATVIDRYGGTVSEFGGDAVVDVFGAPKAHEDDPYRAVRSGLEIVREMRSLGKRRDLPLEIRVEGLVRLQRAIALAAAGRNDEATPDFERAIELFDAYGGVPNLARAEHAYGQSLIAAGRQNRAALHLGSAEKLFNRLGIRSDDEPGG